MAQKRAAADLSRSGKRGTGESMRAKSAAPVVHDFSWQHVAACGSMWQHVAAMCGFDIGVCTGRAGSGSVANMINRCCCCDRCCVVCLL